MTTKTINRKLYQIDLIADMSIQNLAKKSISAIRFSYNGQSIWVHKAKYNSFVRTQKLLLCYNQKKSI